MKRKILNGVGCVGFVLGFIWMLCICGGMDTEKFGTAVALVVSDILILAISYHLMRKYGDEVSEWDEPWK